MSRNRHKWITAGLAAATAGLWGMAFIAPEFHLEHDDVADCRGLGIMAGVALIVLLATGPRLRRLEDRQAAAENTWAEYQEARAARDGGGPGSLGLAGGRSA